MFVVLSQPNHVANLDETWLEESCRNLVLKQKFVSAAKVGKNR